jgi:drug/metabolite transporter (DMT)-like permease
MIHLLLAITCGSVIALILKQGERLNHNRFVILATNYIMAASTALFLCIKDNLFAHLQNLSLQTLRSELQMEHISDGYLSASSTALWCLVIGIPTGVLFFLGFFYYQKSVRESSVAVAGSYAKLGILVPVVLSMLLWRELPSQLQWLGMLLALAAIFLTTIKRTPHVDNKAKIFLLLLFLTSGTAEFTNKLFQRYGMLTLKNLFLFFVFGTALLISLSKIRRRPTRHELVLGLAVGLPNFLASYFLINALAALPASVVFPAYSAGSIAFIAIGGKVLFGEKLKRHEYLAIALTCIALLLIH